MRVSFYLKSNVKSEQFGIRNKILSNTDKENVFNRQKFLIFPP